MPRSATPCTGWLGDAVTRDEDGFISSGSESGGGALLETSVKGVYAAGDVRSGATKQLGSAVGDGIAALLMTRRYLETHHHKAAPVTPAWN